MKQAEFWNRIDSVTLQCELCPHHCRIIKGKSGLCRVRSHRQGILQADSYGLISSLAVDPIEKKPLYHFFPGSAILSLGSVGCNLKCSFCQNWQISQASPDTVSLGEMSPEDVVKRAISSDSIGIAYTYNEPLIWWEFVRDTARCARSHHLKNVLVTNGYAEEAPLRKIMPLIDAVNVDLKAMDDQFYRLRCGGALEPVLRTIRLIHQAGIHLELTNLLITGWNDSEAQIMKVVDWAAELNPLIPLHLSRFFPHYRCTEPPTPPETMERAWLLARRKLSYVYLGNISHSPSADTWCPNCGQIVIQRKGYQILSPNLVDRSCGFCGHPISLVN